MKLKASPRCHVHTSRGYSNVWAALESVGYLVYIHRFPEHVGNLKTRTVFIFSLLTRQWLCLSFILPHV